MEGSMRRMVALLMTVLAVSTSYAQGVRQHSCCGSIRRCDDTAVSCRDSVQKRQDISPATLIIYYEGSNKRVLKAAKKIGAEVIYAYKNFNAVAIRKPDAWTLDATKQYFEKLKGVLQVNYDCIYHIQ